MALRGVASENVVRVTWQADWGGNGTASGTRTWSIPTIGLQIGVNRITVTAHDADRPDRHEGRVGELSSATRGSHGSVVAIIRALACAALLVAASASSALADTLIVTWDQNPEPNVTAYRVFIGTSAGSYTETFDVPGDQTVVRLFECRSRPALLRRRCGAG